MVAWVPLPPSTAPPSSSISPLRCQVPLLHWLQPHNWGVSDPRSLVGGWNRMFTNVYRYSSWQAMRRRTWRWRESRQGIYSLPSVVTRSSTPWSRRPSPAAASFRTSTSRSSARKGREACPSPRACSALYWINNTFLDNYLGFLCECFRHNIYFLFKMFCIVLSQVSCLREHLLHASLFTHKYKINLN